MDEETMDKAELLARIDRGWAELQATLARFDEAALMRPDPATGWAVTDHLVHLAAWEGGIAAVLRRESRALGMGLTDREWRDLTMDQINDRVFAGNRGRDLADVRAFVERVHRDLLAALDLLTDNDLRRGYAYFQPVETGDDDGAPIIGWIIGNTFAHYEEHLGYFRAQLAGET